MSLYGLSAIHALADNPVSSLWAGVQSVASSISPSISDVPINVDANRDVVSGEVEYGRMDNMYKTARSAVAGSQHSSWPSYVAPGQPGKWIQLSTQRGDQSWQWVGPLKQTKENRAYQAGQDAGGVVGDILSMFGLNGLNDAPVSDPMKFVLLAGGAYLIYKWMK